MIHRQDKEWNPEFQIYYYMTDSAGTVLIHPDAKRLVKENIKSYMTKASGNKLGSLTINDSKQDEIKLDGEDVFINTQSVKHTDWYISIVIPRFFIHTAGFIVAGIAITFILIGLLVVYFFGRKSIKKAVRPLNLLATTADEVAKGNFKTELPELKSHDEIHLLRDSFEEMQLSLTKYIEQLQTTTAQKATMESELNIAHNIQMSMLPKTFPPYPQRSDVDIYGMLVPARAVGGDLFDFYIRDEHLFFCIGDVSGKGIPASLVMAVTRSLFRNISAHNSEPAAIVCSINEALVDNNDTGMFVTLFVGVLDLKTGRLLYCNGGHNPPLLISDQVTEMSCDPNLVVGIMPGYTFVAEETTLSHGTTIFLFTDGLNEAEDAALSQFGDNRIHDVASSAVAEHITKPADLVRHMEDAVHQFVGTAEQSDDLTMLAIRYY
jgi:sigma-B regulation protein RsbU (phosphoserine phosphatase)